MVAADHVDHVDHVVHADHDPCSGLGLDPDALLAPAEAASLLKVSPKTIGRWGDRGILPLRRTVGGHRRFRAGDVLSFRAGRKGVGEP